MTYLMDTVVLVIMVMIVVLCDDCEEGVLIQGGPSRPNLLEKFTDLLSTDFAF